jgi:hypothetical protein
MLSVANFASVVMLKVVMLSVVLLSIVAPIFTYIILIVQLKNKVLNRQADRILNKKIQPSKNIL